MSQNPRIAIVGAGLIGHRHAAAFAQAHGVDLAAIVDPASGAGDIAARFQVPHFTDLDGLFAANCADGVVLAVPNQMHAPMALATIGQGLATLVEKPFTATLSEGQTVLNAACAADVPLLTGHHRRYNPLITKAIEVVQSGELGPLTAVQAQTWFLKPDHYFEADWRRQPGAGPVYLNLIHDIDLLHAFCGPITQVQAMESNAQRGFAVEETAVILLRFASGLLGTVNVSDAAAAPWSWELTARENAHYPATDQNCYWIAGTKGSLALPNLAVWSHDGAEGWWSPISAKRLVFPFDDPLIVQATHFGEVIRGNAKPIVSGVDGLAALSVVEAVKEAAKTGQPVHLPHQLSTESTKA